MLSRLGHLLLIVAVLSATGAHWLVLQSVAWASMFANNLQETSLIQSVGRTFDGKNACDLCKCIAKGKQEEKKSDPRVELKKLEFAYAPISFAFRAPDHFQLLSWPAISFNPLEETPPVPPPEWLHV